VSRRNSIIFEKRNTRNYAALPKRSKAQNNKPLNHTRSTVRLELTLFEPAASNTQPDTGSEAET
jgi:hypothetical protein